MSSLLFDIRVGKTVSPSSGAPHMAYKRAIGVVSTTSWPGLSRPSTSIYARGRTWMPGTNRGMTTTNSP
ncbi:hypothetical protein ACVIJ6_000933 [Bradyrhizobium sp. USDA 4369]